MNKTLYIIGNGFDLHHKLDTWYSSFGLFLRDNHSSIYDYFINYFGLPELDEGDEESLKDPLWSEFEASLAGLDIDEVLSEHSEYAANPASDDSSDGDWDTIAVYVGQIRDELTVRMFELFKEFILSVPYPDKTELELLNIDKQALFFNFNYTKSLEYYYEIPKDQILYIHNKADSDDMLILGHEINPKEFERKDEQPPEDLNEEQLEEWRERQSDAFDFSLERGRDELIQYFTQSFKPTSQIIDRNQLFFDSLKSIEKVYVLGHSLANVDKKYFEKIISSINKNKAKWVISYYKSQEINERKQKLISFGLLESQINFIRMSQLE